jgi:hypothetical protein
MPALRRGVFAVHADRNEERVTPMRATADRSVKQETRTIALEAPSGVRLCEHRDTRGRANVELRAPDGTLVLEYRPADGVCRIHAQRVELAADGDLDLRAGGRVRIDAERGVVMSCGESAIELGADEVALRANEITATAERTAWISKSFKVAGDVVETEARRLVQRAGEIETNAQQIVERARETFREVEELAQTHAGRLRFVAKDTLHTLARRATFKAREDLKLRGERIYLE